LRGQKHTNPPRSLRVWAEGDPENVEVVAACDSGDGSAADLAAGQKTRQALGAFKTGNVIQHLGAVRGLRAIEHLDPGVDAVIVGTELLNERVLALVRLDGVVVALGVADVCLRLDHDLVDDGAREKLEAARCPAERTDCREAPDNLAQGPGERRPQRRQVSSGRGKNERATNR